MVRLEKGAQRYKIPWNHLAAIVTELVALRKINAEIVAEKLATGAFRGKILIALRL
jgi:hypothetical protein